MSISDELWRGFQEYLRISLLTQRKAGRSDNNETNASESSE